MPNSIDFYKRISLHGIPARIIVPWYNIHGAPYIVLNLPTNKFEIHYKFIRNLKRFDLEIFVKDFKTSPFTAVNSFDETEDQPDKHTSLVKTKFTRPTAPWMQDIKINNLQHERDRWQHKAGGVKKPNR